MVCNYYSKVASKKHPELPKELQRLAWLSLDEAEGREYLSLQSAAHGAGRVMSRTKAAQQDLVEIVGQFDPKLVKMAPQGERAED